MNKRVMRIADDVLPPPPCNMTEVELRPWLVGFVRANPGRKPHGYIYLAGAKIALGPLHPGAGPHVRILRCFQCNRRWIVVRAEPRITAPWPERSWICTNRCNTEQQLIRIFGKKYSTGA